jgi:hypothetical protein
MTQFFAQTKSGSISLKVSVFNSDHNEWLQQPDQTIAIDNADSDGVLVCLTIDAPCKYSEDVLTLSARVTSFYKDALNIAKESGKSKKFARSAAIQACVALTGRSTAYIGQLIRVSTMPDWLVEQIRQNNLSLNSAVVMERCSRINDLPLTQVYQEILTLANNTRRISSERIYDSHVRKYLKRFF